MKILVACEFSGVVRNAFCKKGHDVTSCDILPGDNDLFEEPLGKHYNGNVFEIKAKGIKETISAGGSYMFDGVQSTGISFGLERLAPLSKVKSKKEKYLVISLKKDKKAIEIAQKLRAKGKVVNIFYGKPSKALEYANSYKIKNVVFVGDKEIKEKLFKVKDMKSGKIKLQSFF